MEEREYGYWLSRIQPMGMITKQRLLALYGSAESIYKEKELPVQEEVQNAAEQARKELGKWLKELNQWEKQGIYWCYQKEKEYPDKLRNLPDPPVGLYYQGALPDAARISVAVIGSRRCSSYGRNAAEMLGRELAERNIQVISGMAAGIDGYAQKAALEAGGDSFGVLGCGTDICYPAGNRGLYKKLQEQGGVISEYLPGTPPLGRNFPLRNRLISGMADLIIVVEAGAKSGSLITVDQALEQGKDVLAVPGRIYDLLSNGCNQLLRQGAGVFTGMEDVWNILHLPETEQKEKKEKLGEAEKQILDCLQTEPEHMEAILEKTSMGYGMLLMKMSRLEQQGYIRQVTGQQYVKTGKKYS